MKVSKDTFFAWCEVTLFDEFDYSYADMLTGGVFDKDKFYKAIKNIVNDEK